MNTVLESLLNDMLALCTQLHALTLRQMGKLEHAEDEVLLAYIDDREEIIASMRALEQRIDALTDTLSAEEQSNAAVQQMRAQTHAILSKTATIDMDTMRILSDRMALYRNATIKARRQRKLSAYLETTMPCDNCSSTDFTK